MIKNLRRKLAAAAVVIVVTAAGAGAAGFICVFRLCARNPSNKPSSDSLTITIDKL